MTRLYNDPADFTDEMIDGFAAANSNYVRRVRGGVVRSTRTVEGSVALVIGGGSGHYPAFGGLVGTGLAHGAATGNVFASPSAEQIYSVALTVHRGGGVLLGYGNYAGDVLHFTQAQERLRAENVDCRSVVVTDDIASASPAEKHKRRGIAGDLTVFKSAAAAAEAGYSLDEVVRVAELANERTRSFGVAFGSCTLPGAEKPLFSVPDGSMAIGMGIHGESGLAEANVPSAAALAELFVARLLDELPDGIPEARGRSVGVILNGLGSIKYEELFVVYKRVAELLDDAGLDVVDPEVGELVTSFDMAGVSLTLFWLDDELERFWRAPVATPGYRKGSVAPVDGSAWEDLDEIVTAVIPPASAESQIAARLAYLALETIATTIDDNVVEIGRIDAVAGDGDHGIGMQRGARAAKEAALTSLSAGAGLQSLLELAGDAWAHRGGGASGALWGGALRTFARCLGNDERPSSAAISAGVRAATTGIMTVGKAAVGDKTMVDALVPFSEVLSREVDDGASLAVAWQKAAGAAAVAAAATADLVPRIGRARPHSEKSIGTPDAGAYSLSLIVQSIAERLAIQKEESQ